MPRSIWKGAISFGVVAIPVRLYPATEDKDISFHLLHKDCGSRLRFLRWCPVHEQEVSPEEIVRGYEYAKDRNVILTAEDFEKLPLPSKHTIEISAFVKGEEIDPVYYEKSYYLEPEETGLKPFALLVEAMTVKGLTGIARLALRQRERLCAVRCHERLLLLDTLYYADEIRLSKATEAPKVALAQRELDMANTLLDVLSEPFEPEKYKDEYRRAVHEMVQRKVEGLEIVEAPAPKEAKVIDLMSALKASVEAAKKRKEEPVAQAAPARRRRAS